MDLLNLLDGYRPYEGIVKNLDNTPVSVAGVAETAEAQLIASVSAKTESNTLVVTYSDMEARSVLSDLRLYTDNAVLFPSKEYVFEYVISGKGYIEAENLAGIILWELNEDSANVLLPHIGNR